VSFSGRDSCSGNIDLIPDQSSRSDYTVLQSHCEYFDRNKGLLLIDISPRRTVLNSFTWFRAWADGVVSMSDTFKGFAALGFPYWFCTLAVMVINFNFACSFPYSTHLDPESYISFLSRLDAGLVGARSFIQNPPQEHSHGQTRIGHGGLRHRRSFW